MINISTVPSTSIGINVLPSEIQHKGSRARSVRSLMVDEERQDRQLVRVSALSLEVWLTQDHLEKWPYRGRWLILIL